jgi:hypothetical protein
MREERPAKAMRGANGGITAARDGQTCLPAPGMGGPDHEIGAFFLLFSLALIHKQLKFGKNDIVIPTSEETYY